MSLARTITVCAIVATALLSTAAFGQQPPLRYVEGAIDVSATVVPNCRIDLTPLRFGSYDPLGMHSNAYLDASTDILLTCTRNSRATVVMDEGRGSAPGRDSRGLLFGNDRLDYQIFTNSERTEIWGRGSRAVHVSSQQSARQRLTVYGRIPAGQEVPSGTYFDVVTATVDF
jgi:spore coat protein U-like protein